MIKNFRVYLLVSVLAFTLSGCAKQSAGTVAPTHAGAANSFDSATYDALVSAQAAIEQAKVGITPSKKALLNQVIAAYNTAEAAYSAYHAAATAGSLMTGQQADLQSKMTALQNGLSQLGAK